MLQIANRKEEDNLTNNLTILLTILWGHSATEINLSHVKFHQHSASVPVYKITMGQLGVS